MPVAIWLFGIMLTAAALHFVVALRTPIPWTVPDELVQSELARSFAAYGHFELRDTAFSARSWGLLYLVVIAPAFRLFGSLPQAYLAVKAINCVLLSCAAVPAYLLARRLLTRQSALLVAFLAVAVPSGIYTTKIMGESLAYPVFLFTTLAILNALERRTARRELLAIGAIGVATLARAQLVVLFPAFVLAVLLVSILEERDSSEGIRLRPLVIRVCRYRFAVGAVAVFLFLVVFGQVLGIAPSGVSGAHAEAFRSASPVRVLQLLALHLAELDLYLTLLPLVAFAVVSTLAFKRGSSLRELRPFCAFTLSVSCCLLALSSRYLASVYQRGYLRAYDRYTFYLVPLFLIAFFVWLREGVPKPRSGRFWLALAFLLPFLLASRPLLLEAWGNPSTVALAPWAFVRLAWGVPTVYALLLAGGAYLSWAVLRGRDRQWLITLVVANFLVINLFVMNAGVATARAHQRAWIGAGVRGDWIDAAAGRNAKVVVLWSGVRLRGIRGWHSIWEAELLNRSVRGVYDLHEGPPYALPEPRLELRGRALYLHRRPLRAEYVLTDVKTPVAGEKIAANRAVGMTLFRVAGAVRLRSSARG